MTTQTPEKLSFGKRFLRGLGWFLKFLLRLVFVIIIGAALGLGVYLASVYGVQLFNNQILQPIRGNTQRLDNLEAYRANDYAVLNQRLESLQEQVNTLVTQGDTHREQLDSLTRRLDLAEKDVSTVLKEVETGKADLKDLASQTADLTPRVKDAEDALLDLKTTYTDLLAVLDAMQVEITALSGEIEDNSALNVLHYDVMMLKAMESLTRARLFLSQENAGLAGEEILDARDRLLILQGMVPDFQKEAVQAILERLDLARENLTAAPNVAVDDLEAAWQFLLIGLPVTAPVVTPMSLVPTGTLTTTLALTPTLSITTTPGITGTLVPTATAVITR